MKYKTFAQIRGLLLGLIGIGTLTGIFLSCRPAQAPEAQPPVAQAPALSSPSSLGTGSPAASDGVASAPPGPGESSANGQGSFAGNRPLTDTEREILQMQKEPLSNGIQSGGGLKWAVKGSGAVKAEFRCDRDKGFDYWNRVKIDYNGNKKYEEKWDFRKDGSVKRRVAPNDNENYTEEYELKGDTWQKK